MMQASPSISTMFTEDLIWSLFLMESEMTLATFFGFFTPIKRPLSSRPTYMRPPSVLWNAAKVLRYSDFQDSFHSVSLFSRSMLSISNHPAHT